LACKGTYIISIENTGINWIVCWKIQPSDAINIYY
jgi:hypothetical protein